MSLKKFKGKRDLLDDNFDLKLEWESWYTSYWDWDDDHWDYSECDNCGKYYCKDYEYCQEYKYLYGTFIDMESVYGKVEMRNRKIDILLGLREPNYSKPVTIGDFFNRIDKHKN